MKKEALNKALEKLRASGEEIDTSSSMELSKAAILEEYYSSKILQKPEIKHTKMQKLLN